MVIDTGLAFHNSLYIYSNLKTIEVIENRQMRFFKIFTYSLFVQNDRIQKILV